MNNDRKNKAKKLADQLILSGKPISEWCEFPFEGIEIDYEEKIPLFWYVKSNISVFRYILERGDVKRIACDICIDGNNIKPTRDIFWTIYAFLYYQVFSLDNWKKIMPFIEKVFTFNSDYVKFLDDIEPYIKAMYDKYGYTGLYTISERLHLEFWQGKFSFSGHWNNPEREPEYT